MNKHIEVMNIKSELLITICITVPKDRNCRNKLLLKQALKNFDILFDTIDTKEKVAEMEILNDSFKNLEKFARNETFNNSPSHGECGTFEAYLLQLNNEKDIYNKYLRDGFRTHLGHAYDTTIYVDRKLMAKFIKSYEKFLLK